jgi:hypothetical protein
MVAAWGDASAAPASPETIPAAAAARARCAFTASELRNRVAAMCAATRDTDARSYSVIGRDSAPGATARDGGGVMRGPAPGVERTRKATVIAFDCSLSATSPAG